MKPFSFDYLDPAVVVRSEVYRFCIYFFFVGQNKNSAYGTTEKKENVLWCWCVKLLIDEVKNCFAFKNTPTVYFVPIYIKKKKT